MSNRMLTIRPAKEQLQSSLLQLDIDPSAERFLVINRSSGRLIYHGVKPSNGTIKKMLFRPSLANSAELTVILFDDNREFNAAIADGVQLELVDANQVDV